MIHLLALASVPVLLALFLLVYVALRAAQTRPGAPDAGTHTALDRVVLAGLTRAIRAGLRVGVRLGPMVMLTVRGRTTGLPRSNRSTCGRTAHTSTSWRPTTKPPTGSATCGQPATAP